jgi:hypothetical protein
MSQDVSIKWTKAGATFADADAAHANKNAGYPAALTESVDACFATMITNGVLIEPISRVWDQETHTLFVRRIATTQEAFDAAITFDGEETVRLAQEAGWSLE